MQWSHPEMQGDLPPPCRAHSATLVGRKIVIFGGGEGATYYHTVHVFDIPSRRWSRPTFTTTDVPPPRRAHTTVLYQNKIWVFGGGNGLQALNDVWALDVGGSLDRMKWEQVTITGRKRPSPRGYHTANLVQNVMIVVGGSDGRECFQDIWCLNLGVSPQPNIASFPAFAHPQFYPYTHRHGSLDTDQTRHGTPPPIALVNTSRFLSFYFRRARRIRVHPRAPPLQSR
jgi:Kelch motif/Galactose oxidase, central domain